MEPAGDVQAAAAGVTGEGATLGDLFAEGYKVAVGFHGCSLVLVVTGSASASSSVLTM